ncbi:MAG: molybdate ABC transporter substrate-binding protein [Gammaproteobacteria bacterium]|nr:molybdate ABC transporter substrate-binding protein [Gammaproteobacteria bacterium]
MKALVITLIALIAVVPSRGDSSLRAAVAANFRDVFLEISQRYELAGGTAISSTFASTGLLYAQIAQGAPYDVFFAADSERPNALIDDGKALAATLMVYAIGRLALWTPGWDHPTSDWLRREWLDKGARIAIANPRHAPYGRAARAVLATYDGTAAIIYASNVSQAFHVTTTGAVEGGFVALAQLTAQNIGADNYWLVPAKLHPAIEQYAIVIPTSNAVEAAEFLQFVQSDSIRALIHDAGYR